MAWGRLSVIHATLPLTSKSVVSVSIIFFPARGLTRDLVRAKDTADWLVKKMILFTQLDYVESQDAQEQRSTLEIPPREYTGC